MKWGITFWHRGSRVCCHRCHWRFVGYRDWWPNTRWNNRVSFSFQLVLGPIFHRLLCWWATAEHDRLYHRRRTRTRRQRTRQRWLLVLNADRRGPCNSVAAKKTTAQQKSCSMGICRNCHCRHQNVNCQQLKVPHRRRLHLTDDFPIFSS